MCIRDRPSMVWKTFVVILLIVKMHLCQVDLTGNITQENYQKYLDLLDQYKENYLNQKYSSYQIHRHHRFLNRILSEGATGEWNYSKSGADWTGECAHGEEQSPIDIQSIRGTCDNTMIFDLKLNSSLQVYNITNEKVTIKGAGNIGSLYATDINGTLRGYDGIQFHFHAPAEHRIESNKYDAELHLFFVVKPGFAVNQRDAAVVGVLFEVDDTASENAFLKALDFGSPGLRTLNLSELIQKKLPDPIVYYSYPGSLTTPPCTERVNWYVVEQTIKVPSSQMAQFNNLWKLNPQFAGGSGNNRIIMPLNERTVKKGGLACEEQFVYFFSFFILYVFINYFIFKLL
eukprot:TRINITY_DN4735_c0_g1_i3.p1 TRINITY_DN4735_c0_g1~~TRINITY_DN4735_c0_g1_i3.p1  ORF type:complete len:345 (+),score=61.41 TRINITY_DN4735_c0_g1_i3:67-1101(+)